MNQPWIYMCSPSRFPPPASLPIRSLWVFPVDQPWALVSCIQPGLVICFKKLTAHTASAPASFFLSFFSKHVSLKTNALPSGSYCFRAMDTCNSMGISPLLGFPSLSTFLTWSEPLLQPPPLLLQIHNFTLILTNTSSSQGSSPVLPIHT